MSLDDAKWLLSSSTFNKQLHKPIEPHLVSFCLWLCTLIGPKQVTTPPHMSVFALIQSIPGFKKKDICQNSTYTHTHTQRGFHLQCGSHWKTNNTQ